MIGKKKRIAKKELQEDKLVATFYKSQGFIEENKQKLLLVLGAIALVILAIVWYANKKSEDNLIASSQLSQILSIYEQGQYQKAIDGEPGTQLVGLKNIVDNYGSTEQGELAKIYLAQSYYFLGDYENSLEYFSDYSGDSKLHKSSALAGEAACYEQMDEFDKAANLYKKAADTYKLEAQTAEFLLNAGINFLKSGNNSEAKRVLESIKNDYNTTPAARELDKYLPQLL